jgi:large conductance mechanosensitive channel
MLSEFKQFIARGNVMDLAVGIIIMPPIGKLMGGIDFSNFFFSLSGGTYTTLKAAQDAGAVTINYGLFINQVINFLIVSFAVFIMVKQVNRIHKKADAAPALTKTESLLQEIRDALKAKS